MWRWTRGPFLLAVLCVAFAGAAGAQVTREGNTKSIAGVLDGDGIDAFTFRASVGQILFADIDGALYQTRGAHEEHEPGTHTDALVSTDDGGCSDEGGNGQFCLQVSRGDEVLCWAGRPAPPPGWQRDPRMACAFEESAGDYVLRVFRTSVESSCADVANAHPPQPGKDPWPYLLNISLRNSVSGGRIEPAIGQSLNQF